MAPIDKNTAAIAQFVGDKFPHAPAIEVIIPNPYPKLIINLTSEFISLPHKHMPHE